MRVLAGFLLTGLPGVLSLSVQVHGRGSAKLGSASRSNSAPDDSFVPTFYAPQLTPQQFLFVSSPTQGKIVYTEIRNFQSISGRTFPLVDSGLGQPCGIAFDRQRGNLYVADRQFNKIFRYYVFVDQSGPTTKLATDGVQITILENTPVQWVAVDPAGDVLYSDTVAKTINKIPASTVDLLASGEISASQLVPVSIADQQAQALVAVQTSNSSGATLDTTDDSTLPQANILVLYEAKSNPNVVTPAGIATDGVRLYWANSAGGTTGGTAVQGEVQPSRLVQFPGTNAPSFQSLSLTNATDSAQGVVRSNKMLFFSSNASGNGAVYGVTESGQPLAFVQGLSSPTGLVWDGDQTVFVADTAASTVYSFPIGRIADSMPLTRSVVLNGAMGLALLSAQDPAFQLRAGSLKASFSLLQWFTFVMFLGIAGADRLAL